MVRRRRETDVECLLLKSPKNIRVSLLLLRLTINLKFLVLLSYRLDKISVL